MPTLTAQSYYQVKFHVTKGSQKSFSAYRKYLIFPWFNWENQAKIGISNSAWKSRKMLCCFGRFVCGDFLNKCILE